MAGEFSRMRRKVAGYEHAAALRAAVEARDAPAAAAVIAYFGSLEGMLIEQMIEAEDAEQPKIAATIKTLRRAIDDLYPKDKPQEEGAPERGAKDLHLDGGGAVY